MISPRLLAPLALAFSLSAAFARPAADTVVLVVRHAEKAGPSGDVPLSAEGEARALSLVEVARGAGVQVVITTQFQRTRQTAAPVAASAGISSEVIAAGNAVGEHVTAIAEAIRGRLAGRTILVVGHSNTVPAIVAALGGPKLPDLCDEQYDALFTIVLSREGASRVIQSRYGAPSESGKGCGAMTH